jgi:hypothetical protein
LRGDHADLIWRNSQLVDIIKDQPRDLIFQLVFYYGLVIRNYTVMVLVLTYANDLIGKGFKMFEVYDDLDI